jgi:hypothetical protein
MSFATASSLLIRFLFHNFLTCPNVMSIYKCFGGTNLSIVTFL